MRINKTIFLKSIKEFGCFAMILLNVYIFSKCNSWGVASINNLHFQYWFLINLGTITVSVLFLNKLLKIII